jgi:hypothetical protein
MQLFPIGLSSPSSPYFGSWGGRFRYFASFTDNADFEFDKYRSFSQTAPRWCAAQHDTWDGATGRDQTLKRWAVELQHDFYARLDWLQSQPAQCNHQPVARIGSDATRLVLAWKVKAGDDISLDASGSTDPDGHTLSYSWVYYKEPGTYDGNVTISNASSASASLKVPSDFGSGDTIHVYVKVADNGSPALSSCRRILLVNEGGATNLDRDNAARPRESGITRILTTGAGSGFEVFLDRQGTWTLTVHDMAGRVLLSRAGVAAGSGSYLVETGEMPALKGRAALAVLNHDGRSAARIITMGK